MTLPLWASTAAASTDTSVGTPLLWVGFVVLVLVLLGLDLGVFHRRDRAIGTREAALWSLFWIGLSLVFNAIISWRFGAEKGIEFLTGYLIEKSLSVDNLFVFLLLFRTFSIPAELQHKVLFWGIFGALVLRAIFITVGLALLHAFEWVIYVFGALLLLAGARLLVKRDPHPNVERNPLFRLFRALMPATTRFHGSSFTVVENGRRHATPLLMVLFAIEASDVVFAIDSIPAIFGVTTDAFIVFTSNIFALLGLRSLYFVLADMLRRFRFLKFGLAFVLLFIGGKMMVSGLWKVPVPVSLGVVAGTLVVSVVASLLVPSRDGAPRGTGQRPPGEA